jgi:hypothetical protein
MDRLIELITPQWPQGFDGWETVVVLAIVGMFKMDRGRIMHHRARFIDRLGWSIIVFDVVFGGLLLLRILWSLYPETALQPWFPRVGSVVLVSVAMWQWRLVRKAPQVRVDQVAAGDAAATASPVYPEIDRRQGPPDRRSEGMALRGLRPWR